MYPVSNYAKHVNHSFTASGEGIILRSEIKEALLVKTGVLILLPDVEVKQKR